MPDVKTILYEICADERVFSNDTDLFDTGLLDSFAFIEFLGRLEDEGVLLQPTRINRELLRTPTGIERLVQDAIMISA